MIKFFYTTKDDEGHHDYSEVYSSYDDCLKAIKVASNFEAYPQIYYTYSFDTDDVSEDDLNIYDSELEDIVDGNLFSIN
jgi:hypothetical protein